MKRLLLAALPLALVGSVLAGSQLAQATPEKDVRLTPTGMTRGAQFEVPRIMGDKLIYGEARVSLPAHEYATVLGHNDAGVIVLLQRKTGATDVDLINPGSEPQALITGVTRGTSFDAPGDGGLLIVTHGRTKKRDSVVRALDARTGETVGRRVFPGYPTVLDVRAGTVLFGSFDQRTTFTWKPATDSVRKLIHQSGGGGSLGAGLVATYTKDPYEGGCTMLTDLRGTIQYWKSCKERVEAISPDGKRIATVDILSDGIGPNVVALRTVRGRLIARYITRNYFGVIQWEGNKALLLDVYGPKKATVARCVATDCERAWKIIPSGMP